MKLFFKAFLLILLQVIFSAYALIDVKVIDVHDGDTITVEINKAPTKIRLIGIDAPELKQLYGPESKKFLSDLLLTKTITLETDKKEKDLYGRTLGYIFINKVLVNELMLQKGQAFYYFVAPNKKYFLQLIKAENEAKGNAIGIWNKERPLLESPKSFRKLPKPKLKKIEIKPATQEDLQNIL